MISKYLRAMLILSFSSILLVACGSKEEASTEVPAAEVPAVAVPAPAPAPSAGGYEPTEEERVPGITEPVAAAN